MTSGLDQPEQIDEVILDEETDEIVLVIKALQPWDDASAIIMQLQEKISQYLRFALAGQLAEEFPQHKDRAVRLQLDCTELPGKPVMQFLDQVDGVLEQTDRVRMVINHLQVIPG